MASRERLDSNRTRTPRENGRSNNNENGRTIKVFKTEMRIYEQSCWSSAENAGGRS